MAGTRGRGWEGAVTRDYPAILPDGGGRSPVRTPPHGRPDYVESLPEPAFGDSGSCSSPTCMYYACMTNVQVRDVPDEVHEALVRRAEQAGQSLQQFLASQLAEIAATPTVKEILDRIERRPKGALSAAAAIEALDEEHARR